MGASLALSLFLSLAYSHSMCVCVGHVGLPGATTNTHTHRGTHTRMLSGVFRFALVLADFGSNFGTKPNVALHALRLSLSLSPSFRPLSLQLIYTYTTACVCVCLKKNHRKFVLSLSFVCYNNKAQGRPFEECIVVLYTNENLKYTHPPRGGWLCVFGFTVHLLMPCLADEREEATK